MAETEKDVMIAEDDIDDLFIFELAIKETKIPIAIRHAKDGDVLFLLLKEKIPELLFLDIHMPCKDGLSCIREIRQSREFDNLPVIMYTADLYNKTIEDCYRNGANFYLVKPETLDDLTDRLQRIFSLDWNGIMHYPTMSQFILK